ncbi:Mu transposase C-terminal domain-containing protein [Candidatus Vondammii sp. HM_W22]|uniref:Mu transposase C-terminal domain-containing protein n=1 Tax=Candidatus Vondammii sp. HM_W22 TaxID=2687299 RepID=UPI001F1469CD|nr:Mu transposase C-terminal domain-containing protein [Candidatus Vondammii sp. HM_W22]
MNKRSPVHSLSNPDTTLVEIAEALGLSKKSVSTRAKRASWPYREKAALGGQRRLYSLTSLPDEMAVSLVMLRIKHHEPSPAEIQKAAKRLSNNAKNRILRQAASEIATKPLAELPEPVETPLVCELKDQQRDRMNARLAILSIIDEMALHANQGKAIKEFIRMANSDELPQSTMDALLLAKSKSHGKNVIDRATIYRWISERTKGVTALAPRCGRKPVYHDWGPLFLEIYQRPQKLSAAKIARDWDTYYPGIPGPSNGRAAQRFLEEIPAEFKNYGRMGKNAIRAIKPFVRRTMDGLWPMDVVTVDGHLFKAYVRHPATGTRFRPEVTTYLDIATRKAIGFSAWIAESQYAIWIALRDMVANPECGVPAIHYSDNGAYRGEQHRATLSRIGTSLMFSEAYRAQARGVIERLNSSVWVPTAKKLPTYCGKDTDQEFFKKALKKADKNGDGLPSWSDFIAGCQQALDDYNNRKHSTLGETPNQAWERAIADGWKPTLLENDDLHDLLPSVERKAIRGEVSLPWGRYFSEDLGLYHGRKVRVSFDPANGAQVWISSLTGELLCTAKRDANARPYVRESQLEHARAKRESGRVERLERKIDSAREEGAYQIEAQPADPIITEMAKANLEQMRREFEETEPAFITPDNDPKRYELWKEIGARQDELSPDEKAFYERFKDAHYCQTMQKLEEEFDQSFAQTDG